MDWRVGPEDPYYNGIANQTMFIQGFKIAVRHGILGKKRINVKAGFPSGRGSRSSGSTVNAQAPRGTGSAFNVDDTEGNLPIDEIDHIREDITIQLERFPQVAKPFHPSDIINQHLLREVPFAIVAVTHDSLWTMLLKRVREMPDP
ncbi:hypothetical protein OG21DRAFT_558497 [Imleria badia]|nr:hypothetical protein OG21DRAFT_558497 [Imleria badia]